MGNRRLLIAEDESEYIENLKDDLEEIVDEFFTAADGVEAMALIKKNQVECILSDINMPNKNGIELVKEVREMGIKIPVIFLSAHGDEELMKKALHYSAFDFVDKPYDVDDLIEVVSDAITLGSKLNESGGNVDEILDDEGEYSQFQKNYLEMLKKRK